MLGVGDFLIAEDEDGEVVQPLAQSGEGVVVHGGSDIDPFDECSYVLSKLADTDGHRSTANLSTENRGSSIRKPCSR